MSNTRVYFITFVFSILVTIRVVHLMEHSFIKVLYLRVLNKYIHTYIRQNVLFNDFHSMLLQDLIHVCSFIESVDNNWTIKIK